MAKDTQASMLLSSDFKFIEQTLIDMGLGEKWISWFRMLYKNPVYKIRVNGHCSDFYST